MGAHGPPHDMEFYARGTLMFGATRVDRFGEVQFVRYLAHPKSKIKRGMKRRKSR